MCALARASGYAAVGGLELVVEVWTVPGAGHTEGLEVEPDEWEHRVVGFLDAHLRRIRPRR